VIDGRDVTDMPPRHRHCGIVFQNYALFPHLSVFNNIAFPLRLRRLRREEVVRRVNETIRLVDLIGFESRLPGQLSGGQQQRVALARAVVFRPRVLIMDEPLGSLDKSLRDQLQIQIRRLQQRLHTTTVYVTHDQTEAFALSDRVALLRNGRLEQVAAPQEIYRKPATIFVARFVGDLSVLPGTVLRSHESRLTVQTDDGVEVHADSSITFESGTRVVCGLRPESVRLHIAEEQADPPRYPMRILAATFQGGHTRVTLLTHSGQQVVADVTGMVEYVDVGAQVHCSWSPSDILVYPEASGDST
jgi:ABC-type Fe3+/spermidine/putrescine transport system ATPase subunit